MITDSRNKGGTLTLDAQPFAKQMTECSLDPSEESAGDDVEALSGDTIESDEVTSWELNLGAIQDFDDPAGFVEFCRANAGQIVTFSWQPNSTGAPTYAGSVKVRAVQIGGAVNTRLTTSKAFPVIGEPSATYNPVP